MQTHDQLPPPQTLRQSDYLLHQLALGAKNLASSLQWEWRNFQYDLYPLLVLLLLFYWMADPGKRGDQKFHPTNWERREGG